MAKIITKKSQIPKSQQKKIKNFAKLTDNQAILQYELNKLNRRLSNRIDYAQFIKTPKAITKSFIQEIHNIRGKQVERFKQKFAKGEPLTSYEERKEKEYKRATSKLSKELDKISEDEIYDLNDSIYDYEPYYPEPDYTLDINDLIEKEKQYESVKDYLEETGQAIDPFTGEVLSPEEVKEKILQRTDVSGSEYLRPSPEPVADIIDSAEDFINRVDEYINQEVDRAIMFNSTYRNGRTRSRRSLDWVSDNIKRAGDKILNELNRIRSNETSLKNFIKKFSDPDKLQQLYDAIGEYLAESYSIVDTSSAYMASEVYMLLNDGPMSLADTMEFEDEE